MKNAFGSSEDNEFLSAGLDNSKMSGSRSMSTQQIINKLQQKNVTLKSQVKKIERVLSSMKVQQKPRYGISLPQIKPDTIKKQLENAYKQIKIYQHQVEKRRNALNGEAAYVEQVNKIEKSYKEKVQIHQRLKRQMLMLKHQSKQLIKQLKNNTKKHEYESLQNKLSTDIKYMKENVRDYEVKRTAHISQLQKQRIMIKEMETEFLKENSNQGLEIIKMKIFKPNNLGQSNLLTPSRSIFDIQNEAAKEQSRISKIKSQVEQTEEITPEAFSALQNDTKLLKKMQTDYENKINHLLKDRDEASEKNFKSRNKLLEVQFEIETIQNNIVELKKLIDPNIFKPKLLKTDEKIKLPVKNKTLLIQHNYKFIESGQITKNGKRFSDRAIIGRVNSKIIAISLYEKEETGEFVGIQATYKLDDQKSTVKKGIINSRLDMKKQAYSQETIKLQGQDYFRTIDLYANKKKIVVGISIVSSKNKILKAGDCLGQRINLAMKESQYPMCFFGSILPDGFECLGVQIFEVQDPKEKEDQ